MMAVEVDMVARLHWSLLVAVGFMGLSCDGKGDGAGKASGTPSSTTDSADSGNEDVLSVCNEGVRWSAGTVAFVDASASWGLPSLMPVGVRVSVADINNDGWPDLIVRSGTTGEVFSEGGTRNTWLLQNSGSGTFIDVTESSGFTAARGGGSGRSAPVVIFADVDNDGDIDAYAGLPDGENTIDETSEILLNDGNGNFSLGPSTSDLRVSRGEMPYGASFVDYDRDGFIDLWVTQYTSSGNPAQDRLYRGDGSGAFSDVTSDVGLTTAAWSNLSIINAGGAHTYAWAAGACDFNGDLWPDLLSPSYGRAPNHLWQNTGGAFVNRSVASGYAYDEGTDWTDNESARCWCTLHPTDDDCAGVPPPELIACSTDSDAFRWNHTYDREAFRLGGNSGTSTCRDVDNDGHIDVLTSEIVHWDVGSSSDPSELLFNTGDADITFVRPGNAATGLSREHRGRTWDDGDITGSIFDFDNDGWPDVYIGSSDYPDTRGLLYHQTSARVFESVVPEDGVDHPRSHGSVVADFDRDGDLDLVVGHSSMRCDSDCRETFEVRLFENQLGEGSNWAQVALQGVGGSNTSAIGARVTLRTDTLTQVQEVRGGAGQWGNQDDLLLHFGMGADCVGELTIQWPDAAGTTESYSIGSGYRWVVTQGGEATPIVD